MFRLIAKWKLAVTGLVVLAVCGATLMVGALRSTASASPPSGGGLSAQVTLDWNLNAVTAVRSSLPSKFQVEGEIYMAYAQAAVYDAVTKISGRYVPYHDFTANPTGASAQAAALCEGKKPILT